MPSTFVIELTPPGRAAVAVVLVDGPNAVEAVGNRFAAAGGRPISQVAVGQILLGRWGGVEGEELIVCRRADDRIEIHCHGGAAAVGRVIGDLVENGCVRIGWQDWLKSARSGVSEKLGRASRRDAATCAAQIALADARTERTAAILLDQFHGALSEALGKAIAMIAAGDWSQAAAMVEELLGRGELGLHLITPWRVVLAGAPNVGKSSLINALAGFQRAIVSPLPGTTRDVVTTTTAIDGWPVQLSDTAGLRTSDDELEAAGVALATATLTHADLVLVVHDATTLEDDVQREAIEVHKLLSEVGCDKRVIHVANKIDLVPSVERNWGDASATYGTPQFVSALTGENVADLVTAIGAALVPIAPPAGAAVPFTAAHVEALACARAAIERRDADAAMMALQALLAGDS